MEDLFLEVGTFLCASYKCGPGNWLCERIMLSLFSGQYFIKRNKKGKLTTYVGWWVIDRDRLDDVINLQHVPDDITTGNMIWVMDAASNDGIGITEAKKHLRSTYPRTGQVKGVAWLRNDVKPVISLRQQGGMICQVAAVKK